MFPSSAQKVITAQRFTTNQPKTTTHHYNSIEQNQLKTLQPGKCLQGGNGKVSMSDRQSEWYLMDKRLIFSCGSINDFQTWIMKIEQQLGVLCMQTV